MTTLQRSHLIAAPLQHVWAVISDVGGVHRFHPKVDRSPLTSALREGLGAGRVCHFYDGTSVREEVTAYEEQRLITFRLSEFSMPLDHAEATIMLKAVDDSTTEVSFVMTYDVKYGPLGGVMNSLMMKPMMTKMFAQVLEGLDHHVVTGDLIGRDGVRIPVAAAA